MSLSELQYTSHKIARDHGFYDGRDDVQNSDTIASHLMLMVSEFAEALEEIRDGHAPDEVYYNPEKPDKPEGFPIELADAIIRIADTSEWLGIDLDQAVRIKEQYNATRPYKHGKTI